MTPPTTHQKSTSGETPSGTATRPVVDRHTAYYVLSAPSGFARATVNLLEHMDRLARAGKPCDGALFMRPERAYNGQSGTAYVSIETLRAYDDYLNLLANGDNAFAMLDRFDSRITRVIGAQLPDLLIELGGSAAHAAYYGRVCSENIGPDWSENDISDVLAAYLRGQYPAGWTAPRLRRPTGTQRSRPRETSNRVR
ncbi:MAG: hypothetical protein ACR2M1_07600 [Gemmatimonadaceae bacterium]